MNLSSVNFVAGYDTHSLQGERYTMTNITKTSLPGIMLVAAGWFFISWLTPMINRLVDLRSIDVWILPYIRMALMFSLTFLYIRQVEKKTFARGFNFYLRDFRKNFLWALVFFAITYLLVHFYQQWIVIPLLDKGVTASSGGMRGAEKPFFGRLFEYGYIVFEGVVEVLIFVGFLVDRLNKRWGPVMAVIAGNVIFALWHYSYWRMGFLTGSLMIILTFIAGSVLSMNYLKTGNSLSTTLCHIFVDSPSALKILLGMGS